MDLDQAIAATEPKSPPTQMDKALAIIQKREDGQYDRVISMLGDQKTWRHTRMAEILTAMTKVTVSADSVARWRGCK